MDLKNRVHVAISTDCVVFGPYGEQLQILLIERNKPPFKGHWALPGGFLEGKETLEETAKRELKEETNVSDIFLQQFFTLSRPDRDPRGRVISTAFYALIRPEDYTLKAACDAENASWFNLQKLPKLAFDHQYIIQMAWETIKRDIRILPVIFEALPLKFTLGQMQKVYESILNEVVDKRNFCKKVLQMSFIEETSQMAKTTKRPAMLYRFNQKTFRDLIAQGYLFYL